MGLIPKKCESHQISRCLQHVNKEKRVYLMSLVIFGLADTLSGQDTEESAPKCQYGELQQFGPGAFSAAT